MNIIKNPMLIGCTTGILTYFYLDWVVREKNKELTKENKKRKKKNKKQLQLEKINLIIPFVVMVLVWFLTFAYFNFNDKQNVNNIPQVENKNKYSKYDTTNSKPLPIMPNRNYGFVKDAVTTSSDPKSFAMINNGVYIPDKLPDIMLEMF